jgi:hypothetical protein
MWEKEYTGMNFHHSWQCPRCCGMLRYYGIDHRLAGSNKFAPRRHTYYKNMRCVNGHYFIIYGNGSSSNGTLVSLQCDDDINWENRYFATAKYFHKYSIPDRIRLRMADSVEGAHYASESC